MRRVLGVLCFVAGASSAVAAENPAPATNVAPKHVVIVEKTTTIKLAPADEYFGPMKMSVLGIRNEIHDLMIRYEPTWDYDHSLANSTMHVAVMTEQSLRDWEQKYPADAQLARYVYLLQHLYAKVQTDEGQAKAKACAGWLITRYGNTWYGKSMRVAQSHPGAASPSQGTASGTASNGSQTGGATDSKPATIAPVPAASQAPAAAATSKP